MADQQTNLPQLLADPDAFRNYVKSSTDAEIETLRLNLLTASKRKNDEISSLHSIDAENKHLLREIRDVLKAVADGDFTKSVTVTEDHESSSNIDMIIEVQTNINIMMNRILNYSEQVLKITNEVSHGELGGQIELDNSQGPVKGVWKSLSDNMNIMALNLTNQVREIVEVVRGVAGGDLSQTINVHAQGEILELQNIINTMVEQLKTFAFEVTRVSRETGVEGRLGGQAVVVDAEGIWKELTDNVNAMATNLTNQVRNIANVTTAVAKGDLSKKVTADCKGEILDLKSTINQMVDSLQTFAMEVTSLATDVGIKGILGGQAVVNGVEGAWKDLTDNVNAMATNLTNQVRSIATVTTAVAHGDLSQKIDVVAEGEILELKNG